MGEPAAGETGREMIWAGAREARGQGSLPSLMPPSQRLAGGQSIGRGILCPGSFISFVSWEI